MKAFRDITGFLAALGLIGFGHVFLKTEPTAAAVFLATACWLIFKDGDK